MTFIVYYSTSITWLGHFRQLILISVLQVVLHVHVHVHSNIPERNLAHMQKYTPSFPGT